MFFERILKNKLFNFELFMYFLYIYMKVHYSAAKHRFHINLSMFCGELFERNSTDPMPDICENLRY